MTTYLIRRLLLMVPTLLGICLVVFVTMELAPGDPGEILMAETGELDPEVAEQMRRYYRERYGLDLPAPVRFVRWLNQIAPIGWELHADGQWGGFQLLKAPDLGRSIVRGRPVWDLIAEALPITVLLNVLSIPLVYLIAITSGVIAARYRGGVFDVTSGTLFLSLWSVPVIWAGVLLIGFLASEEYVRWFPASGLHDTRADQMMFLPVWDDTGFRRGWLLDMLWHMVLPVICLSYAGFAFLSKLARGAILENLSADYARTALAKGVSGQQVLFRHVFRNSMLPLITVAVAIIPGLLGGSVIVESMFGINGMGKLAVDAVFLRDYEVVMATTLIGGLLGMASILTADICYAIADPRVSYE